MIRNINLDVAMAVALLAANLFAWSNVAINIARCLQ